jgi:hypothetical protein
MQCWNEKPPAFKFFSANFSYYLIIISCIQSKPQVAYRKTIKGRRLEYVGQLVRMSNDKRRVRKVKIYHV